MTGVIIFEDLTREKKIVCWSWFKFKLFRAGISYVLKNIQQCNKSVKTKSHKDLKTNSNAWSSYRGKTW